jgi:tetratricopeptide (TPR) repeat protein
MVEIHKMQPLIDLFRIELEIQRAKLQRQYQTALQLYDQAIKIKQNVPNKLGLAKTVAEKAFLLEQLGQIEAAQQQYQYAENIAMGTPNIEFLSTISEKLKHIDGQINF